MAGSAVGEWVSGSNRLGSCWRQRSTSAVTFAINATLPARTFHVLATIRHAQTLQASFVGTTGFGWARLRHTLTDLASLAGRTPDTAAVVKLTHSVLATLSHRARNLSTGMTAGSGCGFAELLWSTLHAQAKIAGTPTVLADLTGRTAGFRLGAVRIHASSL